MQKVQISWPATRRLLEEALSASTLSHGTLGQRSGADYYAIRRMRRKGVRNCTENALRLCSYFGISMDLSRPGKQNIEASDRLHKGDGTTDTDLDAELLSGLLQLLSRYKVERR